MKEMKKGVKIALAAAGATILYGLLGWLALYLCVLLGIWGAVPDMILILVVVWGLMRAWQRWGWVWGKAWSALGLFLCPAAVWGLVFGILQYKVQRGSMDLVWFAALPVVLESLSALVCSGLGGMIFVILYWIQRRKKS